MWPQNAPWYEPFHFDDELDEFTSPGINVGQQYMARPREHSPMREGWRSDPHRPRDNRSTTYRQYPQSQQHRGRDNHSPQGRRSHLESQQRPRSDHPRSNQKRPPPRRSSFSPARSPRGTATRPRYPVESGLDSRDSSPTRYSKRRRTRSPSPSEWSDRGDYNQRRQFSRSRSRERFDKRDTRPVNRRDQPSRGSSPARSGRPRSREPVPEIDSYKPDRRRQDYPPAREYPRRSPSPRYRSVTPPRRRSVSPARDYNSRPASQASRYDSPLPNHRKPRDISPPVEQTRKRSLTRTPSPGPLIDQDPMDGPYAVRGNHGHHNFMSRGRGRGYGNRGGAFRDSPIVSTPNSSHHGSPQSHTSYQGGRNPWDNQQPRDNPRYNNQHYPGDHLMHDRTNGPPFRSNARPVSGSQEDYYRNTPPQSTNGTQTGRSYRGRAGPMNQQYQSIPDRRFSAPFEPPSAPRGRGATYSSNATWTANKREVQSQPQNGPNSVRASPVPAPVPAPQRITPKEPRHAATEERSFDPPRGPQAQNHHDRKDEEPTHRREEDNIQNGRDSKFSFALKSKPPPQSPVKPPAELSFQPKPSTTPTQPSSNRPPPTQPRNKYPDKRPYTNNTQNFSDRRHDVQPPKGPSDRSRGIPTSPRTRSRSPPPKRIKQELKPTLTPEMAASDSIYYRKPGNESVVGAGTYGKVFKAIHIFTKDLVALKKIRMEGERDGFPITAVREIKLLQNLRHRHVVSLQEVMVEKNECFMVFEYLSHDLTGLINHPTFKLSAAHKKDLGRQMFEGLEFLHRRGVMHRDIKAANLLISSTGRLKYADFGLARGYTKSRKLDYTNRVITIWYRPPELLLGETQYGPAVDIWSAACVFMEMFTRKAIFPGEGGELSQLEKIYNVLGSPSKEQWPGIGELPWYELMQVGKKPRVFEDQYGEVLSPAGLDLVRSIFQFDPTRRPDALEVLRHEYFMSEAPKAQQAWELESAGGDWHEYESKAHRRENERKEKEKRREERERKKVDGKVDEVPLAPMPIGEESDGEGSARMSMS